MLNQEEYFSDCVRHAEGGTVVLVRSTDWKVACSSPTQRMYFVYNYCLAGARHGYDYEYHISGAVKSAVAYVLEEASSAVNGGSSGGVLNESTTAASSVPKVLYSEILYYEDCDSEGCTPQYNGNISRMVHHLAHGSPNYSESRDVAYAYDMLNRLTKVEDDVEDYFDEIFNYDAQGRIVQQRRGQNLLAMRYGGEYSYYTGSNQLEKVMGSMSIDDSGNKRDMSAGNNFLFDRDGNMIEDKSKEMTVKYDHLGLPVEFKRESSSSENGADSVRLLLSYDGAGSRISKIRERKSASETEWTTELATHYTGIGSEIREDAINNATKVVVNLPQGLGRYDIASASEPSSSESSANTVPSFEWYLKNHLGSTMLVYGTQSSADPTIANHGSLKAAYDYRAFGEQVDLTRYTDKVTETFTGKEKDDETELSNHGARMLDPMLGLWIAVDPERFFSSPYLYMGNGYNPIRFVDLNGERPGDEFNTPDEAAMDWGLFTNPISKTLNVEHFAFIYRNSNGKFVSANPTMTSVDAFSLKDMQRNRFENPHLESFEPVAMIHTHGENNFFGYPDGYDNDNFSSEDISTSNFLELNLYLFNPTDELKLHDFESKEIKTIDQGNMLE